jgi:hypothetical protein
LISLYSDFAMKTSGQQDDQRPHQCRHPVIADGGNESGQAAVGSRRKATAFPLAVAQFAAVGLTLTTLNV